MCWWVHEKTIEKPMNLSFLRMEFKMKDLEMKEFPSICGLKFIKWNANIIEMPEVFHIKKSIYFKIDCIWFGYKEKYFILTYAYKGIGKLHNYKLNYVQHKLENVKIVWKV